ncbi:MAG: glycosyltransferase [Ilyomonas sp.]
MQADEQKKRILIYYGTYEINTDSSKSIARLIASFIAEVENNFAITFFTYQSNYKDEIIKTSPVFIKSSVLLRAYRLVNNKFAFLKRIKESEIKLKSTESYLKKERKQFDIIIVIEPIHISFIRKTFASSKIIYWIHGLSALYNKSFAADINLVDEVWSPTYIAHKRIVDAIHPIPFYPEFKLFPNWSEPVFANQNESSLTSLQTRHQIDKDTLIFIFAGGDKKLKGKYLLERLIQKLSVCINRKIIFFFAGGQKKGEERLTKMIRVVELGVLTPKDLSCYFGIAHIGLFPSLGGYEHAPLTLLEMIDCGVIPIASNVGGVIEILGAGYPYLIETPNYVDEWVEKITELATLPASKRQDVKNFLQDRRKLYKRIDALTLLEEVP